MVTDLLSELIAIPSVNPEHTDDARIAHEYRLAVFLSSWLSARGFTVEYDPVDDLRGNVIGRYGPAEPRYTVMLEAHLDTVGVEGMIIDPFNPQLREGRLYGRGACDMKGALAAALTALEPAVLEALAASGVQLIVAGAYGEETGNIGAARLADQGVGADEVIVLEPTGCTIVHAHKGVLWCALTLIGEGGHGSNPGKGCNAILAMTDLVPWLCSELTRPFTEEGVEPVMLAGEEGEEAGPTLNIGRISGGNAINIVAPHCRLEIDRRLVPGESTRLILAALEERVKTLCRQGAARDYQIEVLKGGPAFSTRTDSALVQGMQAALKADQCEPRLTAASWHSDAGALSRTSGAVIVFGPGDIAQAHTRDEYIEVADLERGVRVLRTFLQGVATRVSPGGKLS